MKKELNIGLLIMRIGVGLLVLLHGIGNLKNGYQFIKGLLSGVGIPEFIAYGVFLGEIIAPICILIGYRTRIASLLVAFSMVMAILLAHAKDVFALNQFGGWAIELQAIYLLIPAALFFTGAGTHALSLKSKWD